MKRGPTQTNRVHRAPEAEGDELPRAKAFVLQLSRESGPGRATFAGRVEHLSTGRRARFETLEELVAALSRLLSERGQS